MYCFPSNINIQWPQVPYVRSLLDCSLLLMSLSSSPSLVLCARLCLPLCTSVSLCLLPAASLRTRLCSLPACSHPSLPARAAGTAQRCLVFASGPRWWGVKESRDVVGFAGCSSALLLVSGLACPSQGCSLAWLSQVIPDVLRDFRGPGDYLAPLGHVWL